MKESTGGALLMGLAAGIIIIFIIMAAFFISYGKSFKIKDDLINRIEREEGINSETFNNYENNLMGSNELDICVNVLKSGTEVKGITYDVTVNMIFDRTILGGAFKFNIPIKGETKTIQKGNYFDAAKTSYGDIEGIKRCH